MQQAAASQERPSRASWSRGVAGVIAVLVGALAMMIGGTAAFGAGAGTAFAPCQVPGNGLGVHFVVDPAAVPPAISGVVFSGLDPTTCDGQSVVVTFSGNPAGDPKQTTKQLAVFTSIQAPCKGVVLPAADQVLVAAGSITLHGCPTLTDPSGAAYVNLHDVTLMTVQVNGRSVIVIPPTPTDGPTATGTATGTATVTPSPTGTPTATTTATDTSTGTGTLTATATATGTATATPSRTPIVTASTSATVLGETFTKGGPGASSSTGVGAFQTQQVGGASLPFTGTWAALTFWLGLALVVFGVLALWIGRRRRPRTDVSPE